MEKPLFTREFLLDLLIGVDTNCNRYSTTKRPLNQEQAERIAGAILEKLNERAALLHEGARPEVLRAE